MSRIKTSTAQRKPEFIAPGLRVDRATTWDDIESESLELSLDSQLPQEIVSRIMPVSEVDFAAALVDSELNTKRQREFKAGRKLTSCLLARLGRNEPVGVNDDRSPEWPIGVTGSISHSDHWLWSAVASCEHFRAVGIDTEPVVNIATREQLTNEIAGPSEWQIANKAGLDPQQTFTIVFSAKESLYKCWYPVSRSFFGFDQAVIRDADENKLYLELTESNPNFQRGRGLIEVIYAVSGNDVFTATWLDA